MTAPDASGPTGRAPRQVAGPAVEAEREEDAGPPPVVDLREDPTPSSETEPTDGPDTEAEVEPARDERQADEEVEAASDPDPASEAAPAADPAPDGDPDLEPEIRPGDGFMGETDELRRRWEAVQAGFVDDPRRAVEQADEMVSAAVAALQAHIEQRREDLAETWRDGRQASTDALLTAFQRYRELFEGVLRT